MWRNSEVVKACVVSCLVSFAFGLLAARIAAVKDTIGCADMANTATVIVLTAGTITFANEWYQTQHVNWRVPVATIILAAGFDGLAKLAPVAATGLSVMILIAALVTRFNGKSVADTLSQSFGQPPARKATVQ